MLKSDENTCKKSICRASKKYFVILFSIYTQNSNFFFSCRSISGRWQRGGNASNICTVLRQLNHDCEFIGSLSDSQAFSFLIEDFNVRGIRIDHCVRYTKFAPFSSVILNETTGSRTIIHSNPNIPILTVDDFTKIPYERYKWIHFEVSPSVS